MLTTQNYIMHLLVLNKLTELLGNIKMYQGEGGGTALRR